MCAESERKCRGQLLHKGAVQVHHHDTPGLVFLTFLVTAANNHAEGGDYSGQVSRLEMNKKARTSHCSAKYNLVYTPPAWGACKWVEPAPACDTLLDKRVGMAWLANHQFQG